MTSEGIGAGRVIALLRERYAAPGWAFFEEAKTQTGFGRRERYCDGLALGLWPSLGLELIGFEVKVSRGDWLRELKDPSKAQEFQRWCDRWYVVAPQGIVERIELPSTWGLLEVATKGRKKLLMTVEAPRLTPEPLDKKFVAALVRRLHDGLDALADLRSTERFEEERRRAREHEAAVSERLQKATRDAQEELRVLSECVGVTPADMSSWRRDATLRRLKRAMEFLRDEETVRRRVRAAVSQTESLVASLRTLKEAGDVLDAPGSDTEVWHG